MAGGDRGGPHDGHTIVGSVTIRVQSYDGTVGPGNAYCELVIG